MQKKEVGKRLLSAGLAAIMTFGGQTVVFAGESPAFTAKDGGD